MAADVCMPCFGTDVLERLGGEPLRPATIAASAGRNVRWLARTISFNIIEWLLEGEFLMDEPDESLADSFPKRAQSLLCIAK